MTPKTLVSSDEIAEEKVLYPEDRDYKLVKKGLVGPPHQECPKCDAIVVAKARIGLGPRYWKHMREEHGVGEE